MQMNVYWNALEPNPFKRLVIVHGTNNPKIIVSTPVYPLAPVSYKFIALEDSV